MRVIVVGAGEVGTHVAQLLSREGSDVIVIECSAERIAQIDKLLDVSVALPCTIETSSSLSI